MFDQVEGLRVSVPIHRTGIDVRPRNWGASGGVSRFNFAASRGSGERLDQGQQIDGVSDDFAGFWYFAGTGAQSCRCCKSWTGTP